MKSETSEILKAGGFVPLDAKLAKNEAVDIVVARAYRHAVLPGRKVIRLTAKNVVAGDDLEMATLGFFAGEDRGEVAIERKRPLGFPGWALVNDPKNARYALDVVKEFKKHARKAKSKPGHAKDGIDLIADRLGKTVPHFLPSFFEEAGRAFIEHGAQSYAATMFGKAREAEAVHSLDVDEQHRVDGFLEFALAGAVTTKALAQYAKDLGEHHEPKVAYAHFRQLCLQRTLGGMPPWSGMAKELRRLAKAAKLDADAEDAAFIAEIIESPALGKAAGEFWRAYAEPITALGKANPTARGAILNLFPTGTSHNPDLDEAWLDLIDATGALQAFVSDDAPASARPSGGRAAWFDKLLQHLSRSWRNPTISKRAFELLRRMAPMLVADGKPITCAGRYSRIDIDIAELALELGVAVALPEQHARIDVEVWAKHANEPERGRDPVRVAAHPQLGPLLSQSVAGEIGDEPFDTQSRNKAGFLAAKRAWLETTIGNAEQGAMPRLEEAIALINGKVKAETFAELPDLHARFAALDVARALARTLAIGIVDEFGWPELEAAAGEIDPAGPGPASTWPDGKTEFTVHGGPPAVVLATKTKLVAVGPGGKLGEHDLVIPPKHELVTARFIGGQFLVVMKESYKARAYWSAAPRDVFESESSAWHLPALVSRATVLADGAWLESEPIRAGDRKIALGGKVAAYDGTTAWITEFKDGEHRWREVTASGELGRASWPAFIEAGIESDWKIDAASYVLPAPRSTSPLGVRDGFAGVRVRYQGANMHSPTNRDLEMIDGTQWRAPPASSPVRAHAVVKMPGGGDPRPLVEDTAWREGVTVTILSADCKLRGSKIGDKDRRYLRGQVVGLPVMFWHHFVPRDEAGSRRLRTITDADARALIAAVPVQRTTPPGVVHPEPTDLVGVLLEITHPRLRRGVTGFAVMAAQLELERDRLAKERAPSVAIAPTSGGGHDDAILVEALTGWTERVYRVDGRAWSQIERTGDVFGAADRSDRVVRGLSPATLEWLTFAVCRWSLAFAATALGTPASKRRAIAELFEYLVRALPPSDKLRVITASAIPNDAVKYELFELHWHGGNAYAIKRRNAYGLQFRILEYAPDGVFRPHPRYAFDEVIEGGRGPTVTDASALLAAVADGTTTWSAEGARRLASLTGLTPSEASFLLAGCPNANDRSANFLDKELREQLGLKAAQAALARDTMQAIRIERRIQVVEEAASHGIAALLAPSLIDALAAAWNRIVGARVAVPEELISAADRELPETMAPSVAFAMFANPAGSQYLTIDGTFGLDRKGDVIRTSNPEPLVGQSKLEVEAPAFGAGILFGVVYIPFLYAELPVGDRLRAQATDVHRSVLQRLANPGLWFEAGGHYMDADADGARVIDRLLDGIGGEAVTGLDDGYTARRVPGAVFVRAQSQLEMKLHPASLDAKAAAHVAKLAALFADGYVSVWRALEYARSADLAAIIERIDKTPVPAGGWEQNPLASAPKLVDKVAKHIRTSKDAAALYLQYLTLLWPTPKNLQRWNGWKPKQLDAANAELLDKALVLEAKRERAQRPYFLPGGWEALKSPDPPMESWKVSLYGTRDADGDPQAPLQRFLAMAPFHVLFERAWQRIESGDKPRYEEVKR